MVIRNVLTSSNNKRFYSAIFVPLVWESLFGACIWSGPFYIFTDGTSFCAIQYKAAGVVTLALRVVWTSAGHPPHFAILYHFHFMNDPPCRAFYL